MGTVVAVAAICSPLLSLAVIAIMLVNMGRETKRRQDAQHEQNSTAIRSVEGRVTVLETTVRETLRPIASWVRSHGGV